MALYLHFSMRLHGVSFPQALGRHCLWISIKYLLYDWGREDGLVGDVALTGDITKMLWENKKMHPNHSTGGFSNDLLFLLSIHLSYVEILINL